MASQYKKLDSCIEIDTMLTHLMGEINMHNSVAHCERLGLLEPLRLIVDSIQNLHGKTKVIYQAEAKIGMH